MRFLAKVPGLSYEIKAVDMDFSYSSSFHREIADSYEKILLDTMMADQTLFATSQGFAATWKYITSIIKIWEKQGKPGFPNYAAGSWGPKEAEELIENDGRKWTI